MHSQFPLWVKSGRDALKFQCPLYPRKRTFAHAIGMSALGQKQTSAHLLNHFIGASKQRRWHIKAERLGRLEIDH